MRFCVMSIHGLFPCGIGKAITILYRRGALQEEHRHHRQGWKNIPYVVNRE